MTVEEIALVVPTFFIPTATAMFPLAMDCISFCSSAIISNTRVILSLKRRVWNK